MTKIYFIRISLYYFNYYYYYYYYYIIFIILYHIILHIFVISYYKNVRLLILIMGFKQIGKRLQKQDFMTLRGLLFILLQSSNPIFHPCLLILVQFSSVEECYPLKACTFFIFTLMTTTTTTIIIIINIKHKICIGLQHYHSTLN